MQDLLHNLLVLMISFGVACLQDFLSLQRVPGGLKGFWTVSLFGAVLTCYVLGPLLWEPLRFVSAVGIGSFIATWIFGHIQWDY